MTQTQQPATRWQEQRAAQTSQQREHQLEDVRQKMHQFVIHELGPLLTDQRVSEAELRRQVDEQLLRALSQERFALTVAERQALVQSVTDDVLGYGPIDPLLRDDTITEVMVNGCRPNWGRRVSNSLKPPSIGAITGRPSQRRRRGGSVVF